MQKNNNKKMKNRQKNRTPCLPWNPAQGYKSQSLPKFLNRRLIFFHFRWPIFGSCRYIPPQEEN